MTGHQAYRKVMSNLNPVSRLSEFKLLNTFLTSLPYYHCISSSTKVSFKEYLKIKPTFASEINLIFHENFWIFQFF